MEVTNEVIWERLNTLMSDNKEAHDRIDTHLAKLNGSVSSLKAWRSYITGAVSILTVIVIPVALMVFAKFLEGGA